MMVHQPQFPAVPSMVSIPSRWLDNFPTQSREESRLELSAACSTGDRSLQCAQRIMQRAAMRRIDTNAVFRTPFQANEGAGPGTVSMQDVRLQPPGQAHETQPYQNVRGKWLAAASETMDRWLTKHDRNARTRRLSRERRTSRLAPRIAAIAATHARDRCIAVSAVRLSIAAAAVIEKPSPVMTMRPRWGSQPHPGARRCNLRSVFWRA
jgi:hypothetical protein